MRERAGVWSQPFAIAPMKSAIAVLLLGKPEGEDDVGMVQAMSGAAPR